MSDRPMDLRERATVAALAKMFRPDGYFDICTVDGLVKVWGLVIPADTYATMRLLHCVHYAQMPSGTREDLMRLITDAVRDRVPDVNWQDAIFGPPAPNAKPSMLRRLIQGATP